jgi:hypothetical protein
MIARKRSMVDVRGSRGKKPGRENAQRREKVPGNYASKTPCHDQNRLDARELCAQFLAIPA